VMRRCRMLPEMMRGRGMSGPWGHGRGGHEGPLISMMLHWKDQLALTAEQERSLRELRATFGKQAIRRTSEIDVAELELRELLEQEKVDLAKVEAWTKKIALLRADQRLARIKTIEAGKAQLTPEQQRKLERLSHDSRMGEPGKGMMGPGMRMMPPVH
jgi:Spy/CpxP family protein refolding chaperone